jgi:Arc/MetJ-type ribon-helix-helix transcriptional regulator
MSKERLTVTVDQDLVDAGNDAVAEGRAASLSAWVNLVLAERAAKERRLRALDEAIAAYESQVGVITTDEMRVQQRADRAAARVVRGPKVARAKPRRRSPTA